MAVVLSSQARWVLVTATSKLQGHFNLALGSSVCLLLTFMLHTFFCTCKAKINLANLREFKIDRDKGNANVTLASLGHRKR